MQELIEKYPILMIPIIIILITVGMYLRDIIRDKNQFK